MKTAERVIQGKSFPVLLVLGLIQIYQRTLSIMLRAVFGNSCRFYPSCSDYAGGGDCQIRPAQGALVRRLTNLQMPSLSSGRV